MIEILNKYASFLWERFMSDMDVLSNKWMYIPLLIPFIFYMIFFVIKWYILLFPITLPLSILKGMFKVRFGNRNKIDFDFSEGEILKEMHDDMDFFGIPNERIETLTKKWKRNYSIRRRRKNDID